MVFHSESPLVAIKLINLSIRFSMPVYGAIGTVKCNRRNKYASCSFLTDILNFLTLIIFSYLHLGHKTHLGQFIGFYPYSHLKNLIDIKVHIAIIISIKRIGKKIFSRGKPREVPFNNFIPCVSGKTFENFCKATGIIS